MQLVNRVDAIQDAIEYIECHLNDAIDIERVASVACMSLSGFYEFFKVLTGMTLKEYIRKRRLSEAAFLLTSTDRTVLEVALDFQYDSYEAFSRAFKLLYGMSPSAYRKRADFVATFPQIQKIKISERKDKRMQIDYKMNNDQIIEGVNQLGDGYMIDVDIDYFGKINENYGRSGGDFVLAELPHRVKEVLKTMGYQTEVTRLGADEFIILVKDEDEANIKALADAILKRCSETYHFNAQEIHLTVSIGVIPINVGVDPQDSLKAVEASMFTAKRNGRNRLEINNI